MGGAARPGSGLTGRSLGWRAERRARLHQRPPSLLPPLPSLPQPTRSSYKSRFKVTGTGKVSAQLAAGGRGGGAEPRRPLQASTAGSPTRPSSPCPPSCCLPQVLFDRPGHVHKRFNKSKSALFRLSAKRVMRPAYAKVVRKLGFKTRNLS